MIPEIKLDDGLNTVMPIKDIDADIMYAVSGPWTDEDKEKLRKALKEKEQNARS